MARNKYEMTEAAAKRIAADLAERSSTNGSTNYADVLLALQKEGFQQHTTRYVAELLLYLANTDRRALAIAIGKICANRLHYLIEAVEAQAHATKNMAHELQNCGTREPGPETEEA